MCVCVCESFYSKCKKAIHASHTERQHECSSQKIKEEQRKDNAMLKRGGRERERKKRIEKRSKKRTKITCNDRTGAPDVYNYLCIAERENGKEREREREAHIHSVVLRSFVSILVLTARLFSSAAAEALSCNIFFSQQFYSLRLFVCNLSPMTV